MSDAVERVARALCKRGRQDPEALCVNVRSAKPDEFIVPWSRIPGGYVAAADGRFRGEMFPLWMFFREEAAAMIEIVGATDA